MDHNKQLSHIQFSGCTTGIDDTIMAQIADLTETLNFLDISFCKQVTDQGFAAFAEKTYPLDTLVINGCNGISGEGLKQLLHSFKDTLLDLEAALNDQQIFNCSFFETLGFCFNLETLDVTGSNAITGDGVTLLSNAAITHGNESVKPGLAFCHTLKINGASIGDAHMGTLAKIMPNLEHLEIIKCIEVAEFGINTLIEKLPKLQFLDVAKIPIINYGIYL